jgi:hypothetical protein
MSWRFCGNRWRRVFYTENLPHIFDLVAFAALAARVMAPTCLRETRSSSHGDALRQGSLVTPHGSVSFGHTRLTSHSESGN